MFSKTNKSTKTNNQPLFEKLEDRKLQSTTPLNFNGQYVNYTNNVRYEVDFKHDATNLTKYTGDVKTGTTDLKLTATESNNKLAGSFKQTNGTTVKFNAALSGQTLTLTVGTNKVVYTKRTVTMAPHTAGGLFEYDAPSGWTAKANAGGILIKSSDGTQQVSVFSGVQTGYVTPEDLLTKAKAHGTKVTKTKAIPVSYIGSGLYLNIEAAEMTFNVGTKNYTSDVIMGTIFNLPYNFSKIGVGSITAPTSVFASKGNVLVDILGSIHQISSGAAPAAAPAAASNTASFAPAAVSNIWSSMDYGYTFTNGFYDPGVQGNWAYGYTTAWVSPFVAAEQVYMAQRSTAFDASVAAWHDQFMNT